MDQLSLAAVTADVHDRVRILSDGYNYPLRHRAGLAPEAVELDLAQIVHLHYRLWFHMQDALRAGQPAVRPGVRAVPLARRAAADPARGRSGGLARRVDLGRDPRVARVQALGLEQLPAGGGGVAFA